MEELLKQGNIEFRKKFVTKCSDGELIADFKDGKILKPKEILDWHNSQMKLAYKQGWKDRQGEVDFLRNEAYGESLLT